MIFLGPQSVIVMLTSAQVNGHSLAYIRNEHFRLVKRRRVISLIVSE